MPKPSSSFDAIVVGGGVIGLSVAWRTAQRGLRVLLVERGDPGAGTSRVAAGMLAPVSEASLVEQAVLGLGLASARLYPGFVQELQAASGVDPGYLACGTLAVARDRDEAEALDRELKARHRLGLTVERLRPSQARALEPALAPAVRLALWAEDDHAVDPRQLSAALVQACEAAGVGLRLGEGVAALTLNSAGVVSGVRLDGGDRVGAPQVVIAAGTWAGEIAGIPDALRVPLHPVKGQILRLHDPAGPGLLSRVLRMGSGYVLPRGDGRYVLGATMEERGFDTTVTAGAVSELLRDAGELIPGISELVIDEISAGLRPATPDNAPALGPASLAGLHWAVGHYRNGILLAPVTAEILADSLEGQESPAYAAAFGPERFGRQPIPVEA
ncbi:MAG: glycine oxidase ThiO [Solirubrobacterales bacterium]|nr:glycine oxidase ThiO [Solirubrobacterales bacterium]